MLRLAKEQTHIYVRELCLGFKDNFAQPNYET